MTAYIYNDFLLLLGPKDHHYHQKMNTIMSEENNISTICSVFFDRRTWVINEIF